MEDQFNETQNHQQPENQHQPPQQHAQNTNHDEQPPNIQSSNYENNLPFSHQPQPEEQPPAYKENQNDFDEFEQDEVTKKIRQQEQRIQNLLAQKSQKQWEQKQKRKQQGKRQLEEYNAKKEQEKEQRVSQNIRKESENKQKYAKINLEAGWNKVVSSINVKQGEHKGSRDINRMREAILHKKQDDTS